MRANRAIVNREDGRLRVVLYVLIPAQGRADRVPRCALLDAPAGGEPVIDVTRERQVNGRLRVGF
jgi:hypothetical protein